MQRDYIHQFFTRIVLGANERLKSFEENEEKGQKKKER
jgi:hypothetical protein